MLAEAAAWLCAAQAAIRLVPFRWLAPWLGVQHGPADANETERARHGVERRASLAIGTASRHLPWRPTCLARATAAKAMLRVRGVSSTLYLGVARDGEVGLRAHAWLTARGDVLTGGDEARGYEVISSFT